MGMLSPDGRPPQKIEVTINSGEPNEKKVLGNLAQIDPVFDLAVVIVPGKEVPDPLPLALAKDLVETQPLFVFGFPFGKQLGKNITVAKTSVTSLRKNPNGSIRDVQVNGGMHPGNSGGPVVDAKGQVVGVSVAAVRDTQINFAVPSESVQNFLNARLYGSTLLSPFREGKDLRLGVVYTMVDPLNLITKVTVDVWSGKDGPPRKGNIKTGVEPQQPDDGPHQSTELVYKDRIARGDVLLPTVPKGHIVWMQVIYERRNGKKTWQNATVYNNRFAPVERKPVTVVYKHQPEMPAQLDVTTTTDLKLASPRRHQQAPRRRG